jgi:hypothetical protein
VPDIPTPETLGTYLKDVERRVRILETAPRAEDTTFPITFNELDSTFTTSSTSFVDSSPAGPTITVNIGQSGRVLVSASSYIGLNNTGMGAFMTLFVNGSDLLEIVGLSNNVSAIAANVSSTRAITGLTPGPNTFHLKYFVTSGTANFSARSLTVQTF